MYVVYVLSREMYFKVLFLIGIVFGTCSSTSVDFKSKLITLFDFIFRFRIQSTTVDSLFALVSSLLARKFQATCPLPFARQSLFLVQTLIDGLRFYLRHLPYKGHSTRPEEGGTCVRIEGKALDSYYLFFFGGGGGGRVRGWGGGGW